MANSVKIIEATIKRWAFDKIIVGTLVCHYSTDEIWIVGSRVAIRLTDGHTCVEGDEDWYKPEYIALNRGDTVEVGVKVQ